MRPKILCIEDDLTIQALIEGSLKEYSLVFAKNINEAEREIAKNEFSAILMDIELPDGDGIRFYTKMVQDVKFKKIPTLIVSGHSDISNKLLAFSLGADDFISKPFDPLELNARVAARIKRSQGEAVDRQVKRVGDVEIDFDRQKALHMGHSKEKDLGLTGIELKILSLLARRLEQVYSREQILTEVWGETFITDRTVDSHIAHLRSKIETTKLVVETVKNFGYRLNLKAL